MSALGRMVVEGRAAVPPQFLIDMAVNRALSPDDFEIGDEFLDDCDGLDVFDNDDALYVIVFDSKDDAYLGSARLIPTTGPNLLRDAAPYLLEFGATVEGPRVWELSRVCAMTNGRSGEGRGHSLDAVVGELLAGAVELANRAGVTHIVSVAGDRTMDALERIGCAPRLMPRPAVGPECAPHVALLDVGEITLQRIRKMVRTKGDVVAFGRKIREGA